MKTRILLVGANGYVGSKLYLAFIEAGWEVICPTRLTLYDCLRDKESKYDYLVNAAGYCGKPNVDACLDNKAQVMEDNVLLPALLANWCEAQMIPMVHISSGCLYAGSKPSGPFTESDEPNFSFVSQHEGSYYSGSKAAAETIVRRLWRHYILRLRMPFNGEVYNRNLLVKLMKYGRIVDTINSITNIDEFVESVVCIIRGRLPYGTWNLVNSRPIYTNEICSFLQKHIPQSFEFFDSYIDFSRTVREPRSSCLLSNKKANDFGLMLTPTEESLDRACFQLANAK